MVQLHCKIDNQVITDQILYVSELVKRSKPKVNRFKFKLVNSVNPSIWHPILKRIHIIIGNTYKKNKK